MKNKFDQKSENELNGQLIQSFQEEFQPKSHFEEWLAVYRTFGLVRLLLQAVSLTMAVTLLAYPAKYFLNSWIIGIPPAILILIALELIKRRSADVGFRRLFTERKIPAFVLTVAIVASGLSVVSSVFGTPLFVAEVTPPPKLIDTASINLAATAQKEAATAFWSPQIEKAQGDAEKTFKEGNWKGKISGRTKDQKYSHEKRAAAFQDSLNSALSRIDNDLTAAIAGAIGDNQSTIEGANRQTADVGFWTAIGCLALEVLFYLISFFLVRFKYISSLQLSEGQDQAKEEKPLPINPAPTPGGGKKTKKEATVSDLEALQQMFPDIARRFTDALNETETEQKQKQETGSETRDETETKQEQTGGNIELAEGNEENETEIQQQQGTKTVIINKNVNHGTPTFRDGKKVLYYITNKGKKDESVRYYSEAEIEKMIKTYERRLAIARSQKKTSSIKTNMAALTKWKEHRFRLNNYQPEFA